MDGGARGPRRRRGARRRARARRGRRAHRSTPGCATPTCRCSTAPSRSRRRSCSATRAPASSRRSATRVRKVQVGDHVVLTTLGSCGLCDACDRGQPTHCRDTMGRLQPPVHRGGREGVPVRQRRRVHRAHRRGREPGGRHLQGDAARGRLPHRLRGRHRRRRGAQPGQGAAGRDGGRDRRRRHRPVGRSRRPASAPPAASS